jgi:hypothetical protein
VGSTGLMYMMTPRGRLWRRALSVVIAVVKLLRSVDCTVDQGRRSRQLPSPDIVSTHNYEVVAGGSQRSDLPRFSNLERIY